MLLLALALSAPPAPPGVIVAHSPAKSRQYIGSPSLAVLPSGEYLASHDFFGPGSSRDTTAVYASADRGKTWAHRATVKGQWWSTLFAHRGAVYLIGTSKEYGACVIRKSTDGGRTWTAPADAASGLLLADGLYHCAPVPVVEHNGRLWRAMEGYTGPKWGAFTAFVMSAPVDADLLNASSWASTNRLARDAAWLGGKFGGWLEGNAVVGPDGNLVNILRVHQPDFPEKAAITRVRDDGKSLAFDPAHDFIEFPGGSKKFTVRFDPQTKRYWALANFVPEGRRGPSPDRRRNTLALASSADLRTWDVRRTVAEHPDDKHVGFQYVDWSFDGDDLIAAVRTAFPEPDGTPAHNQHDANWLTFLRVERFRGAGEPWERLGKLSEKYESGGRGPATVSTGVGDPGGVSYGTYQLASKVGRADAFVKRYYPAEFAGLKGGTPEFTARWKKLAADAPAELRRREHEYIRETHYDPQVKKLKADLGLDVGERSAALRDVTWSTAVQHGPTTDVIVAAVKPLLVGKRQVAGVTDEAIIRAVYAERGRMTPGGKLARFPRVSDAWIPGLTKRFESEQADALRMLATGK